MVGLTSALPGVVLGPFGFSNKQINTVFKAVNWAWAERSRLLKAAAEREVKRPTICHDAWEMPGGLIAFRGPFQASAAERAAEEAAKQAAVDASRLARDRTAQALGELNNRSAGKSSARGYPRRAGQIRNQSRAAHPCGI